MGANCPTGEDNPVIERVGCDPPQHAAWLLGLFCSVSVFGAFCLVSPLCSRYCFLAEVPPQDIADANVTCKNTTRWVGALQEASR